MRKLKACIQFTLGILPSTATVDEAESELNAFEAAWGNKFPSIGKFWRNHWGNLITLFDYPDDIRIAIYTTNTI